MCLIAVAPKGTDKYSDEFIRGLFNGSVTNTDGIGFAFKRDKTKKVYISKGYKNIEDVIKELKSKKLSKNDELIVHLRIGNRGSVNTEMCHPFVLAKEKENILSNDKYVNYPVMAHNGTFYSYNNDHYYSDTYKFIAEFMYHPLIIQLLKDDKIFFKETFSTKLSTNKLSFLFPNCDTNLILIGDFKENNNYFYSNDSYKDKTIVNVGGVESKNKLSLNEWGDDYDNSGNISLMEDYFNKRYNLIDDFEEEKEKPTNNLKKVLDDTQLLSTIFCTEPSELTLYEDVNKYRIIIDKSKDKLDDNDNHSVIKYTGYRTSNNEEIKYNIDLPVAFKDTRNNVSFINVMDLLIPSIFNTSTQFESIQIKPNLFNYTDLYVKALKDDSEYNIVRDSTYYINDIGDDGNFYVLTKIQNSNYKDKHEFIYIPSIYVHELFEIKPLNKYISKYLQYYQLVKNIPATITSLKHLTTYLQHISKHGKNANKIAYRNAGLVTLPALDLFKYVCCEKVHGSHKDNSAINNKCMF